jgi:acyl-CoA reductase-like NAD-dependent aldehyde dehydrogenase
MLLPRSRYDEGVEAIERAFRTVSVGDPQDPETSMGPVISAKQRERVRGYIQSGIDEGATLLLGGVEPPDGLDVGFFVRPTVFVDVDNSMTIAQEEIFGPVLAVIPYDGDDEAVQIANASAYGLFGVVLSGSLDRAKAVGARIRVGGMALNGGVPTGAEVPFGGFKASGVGRQNGVAGFDQYVELKATAWPEQ